MKTDQLSFATQERGNLRYRCLSLAATCSLLGAVLTPYPGGAHAVIPRPNLVPDVRAAQPVARQYHNVNPVSSRGGVFSAGTSRRSSDANSRTEVKSLTSVAPAARSNSATANAAASSTVSQSSSTTAVNLDLSSSAKSVTAGSLLGAKTVTIEVGGQKLSVNSNTLLTPAEKVAVYQVVLTGKQALSLSSMGSADGGTVVLSSRLSQNIGNLVIPDGVTVIDLSKTGTLDLSGNLTDSGTLYISDKGSTPVSLQANNIYVQQGGTITDVKASGGPSNPASSTGENLSVTTQSDVDNGGTISSSGTLSVTAGGTINNIPSTTGSAGGVQPTMKSQGDLSLVTGSGTINNSGVINSSKGNINISASLPQTDISINASNGSFQALNGAINVRDASYTGAGNLSLSGGDYQSSAMNLYSGSGNVNTNVNSISGLLGINANAAHTTVATGALNLGTMNLKGDPTFYNTDGNITIGGNISVGEALSIVASGNILSTGSYSITADNGTSGAQINLVAGADIATSSGTNSPIVGGGSGTAATAPITISGPSSSGGDVSFSGQNMTISSAAVSGNSAGGDVNVVAFANPAGTSGGHVSLSSGTSINTSGAGTGANGNVSILAGASNGVAVTTGSITTSGGSGSGGDITIETAQPSSTAVTINTNGALAPANKFVAGPTVNAAAITVNAPITSGGNVSITTGSGVNLNSTVNAVNASENITIQSPGNLTLTGNGTLQTTSTGVTSLLAMGAGSTLTVGSGSNLSVAGGGTVDIRTPNLTFAGQRSSLNATGESDIFVDSGNSAANVDLNVSGAGTLSTNGGIIDVSATGLGNITFAKSGAASSTINLNSAGTNGAGLVDVHGLGDITVNKGVTLASNSPIQFNMNNLFTLHEQTFTNNGVIKTTAANAAFPDPLGGSMYYSILVQNLISNFNLAGSGSFIQAGANPGNTVFNDFTNVNILNGSNLTFQSTNKGGYVNFFTRQITLAGSGVLNAALNIKNENGVNFNTNLPSFGPGDVAFIADPSATSATLNINGAPVTVGFQGSPPPVSIPAMQEPVSNITVGSKFNLLANNPISMYATNSVNVLGTVSGKGGSGVLAVQSPTGDSLDLGGGGTLQARGIALSSLSSGTNINFNSNLTLLGTTLLSAPTGAVTIAPGASVKHSGSHVIVVSSAPVPAGFKPPGGVLRFPHFALGGSGSPAVNIVTPTLNVGGSVTASK